MPKVSVILTSYNHEKYICEAIDSVLNQTFTDLELIIWDDASTDNSWYLINQYSDSRIKAYRNDVQQRGIWGLNKAISEVATGKYIAIHHSDDVWELGKLEKQVAFLDENPQIGAAFTNVLAIAEDSSLLVDEQHPYFKIFNQPNRTRHEWLRYFFSSGNALCHPSVLIRKSCYEDCGPYRFGLAQLCDFDMWIRLCLKWEIYVFPEKLTRFRVRENERNTSGNRPDARIRGYYEYFKLLQNFRKFASFKELVEVFPSATKYYRNEESDMDFALAMMALEEKPFRFTQLFGLNILFEAISDPKHAAIIKRLYNFDYRSFIDLTAKNDVFSREELANLWSTLIEREGQINSLNQVVAERDGQVANLNHAVAERDGQVANLNHAVAERDGQVASLNHAVTERDGQVASLNHGVAERERQISNLNQAVAEREGQISNLNQAVAEREGQIRNLNQAVSEHEGRIIAYHNVVMGRDDTINALSNLVAERDRIIQETYRSHSWRLTKPIRFLSRTVRKVLNFGLKFKPSKINFIYNLAKPHLKTVIRNPGRLKSKLHFFNIAWQSGGYRGVIRQLQQTSTSNPTISKPSNEVSVIEVMQQLTRIPHALKPTDSSYSVAETASGYRRDSCPVVLFISHTYGGGTEKHIIELADALSANNARVLLLRPFNGENGCDVRLEAFKSEILKVDLSSQNIDLLAGAIKAFAVSKVHVHHTIGFGFSIEELLIAIGLPYDVTIHDYYSICPLINLRTTNKGYCGSPTTDDCNACLALEPARAGGIEITWWRAKYASLLNGANAVYCPSRDTANRIAEHYPAAPLQVVLHEDINLPSVRYATEARTTRRIAILGVLASHKGLSLIEDALAVIEKNELPIEIALIGYPERAISGSKALTQTGPYIDSDLPALIEKSDPDAILFPAQWPETYSYTLTTAILSGRPIVVANLGSLPERVKDISNAFVYPYEYTAVELVEYLLTLHLGQDGSNEQNRGAVSRG